MAKVTFKVKDRDGIGKIARSAALGDTLEAVAAPVLAAAQRDSNQYYVSTLRMKRFISRGRRGRVSVQVGAAPIIGGHVEAKRGTLARAVGAAGL